MLKITFRNSETCYWKENEFTDYRYDGKCLILIKDCEWVALYNIDCIASFVRLEKGE